MIDFRKEKTMGKIGISDRLNANSKKNIIFAKDYRKVRLDPRTLIPSEHNKYSQDNIEELADNMLLVGQLQEIIVGRVAGQERQQSLISNVVMMNLSLWTAR